MKYSEKAWAWRAVSSCAASGSGLTSNVIGWTGVALRMAWPKWNARECDYATARARLLPQQVYEQRGRYATR